MELEDEIREAMEKHDQEARNEGPGTPSAILKALGYDYQALGRGLLPWAMKMVAQWYPVAKSESDEEDPGYTVLKHEDVMNFTTALARGFATGVQVERDRQWRNRKEL